MHHEVIVQRHPGRVRSTPAVLQGWRLLCSTIALLIAVAGGLEVPVALGQAEAAVDGVEAEEVVCQERRSQSRRRNAQSGRLDPATTVCVAPADVATALVAFASIPFERTTGRDRRHQHKSLVI